MRLTDYLDKKHATKLILRAWHDQEFRLDKAGETIAGINDRMTSLQSAMGSTPVQGGSSRTEDKWVAGIDQKVAIEVQMQDAVEFFEQLLPAWNRLTPDEQYVLQVQFIDNKETEGSIRLISERYGLQRTEAYAKVNGALMRLATLLF